MDSSYKPSSVQRRKLVEDIKRCECGQRMSKWANHCRQCDQKRSIEHAKEFIEFEKSGACPQCGGQIAYNSSIAGSYWLQCIDGKTNTSPWHHKLVATTTPTQPTPELHDDDTFKNCNWQFLANSNDVDQLKGQL
jgi:hypothetical protein